MEYFIKTIEGTDYIKMVKEGITSFIPNDPRNADYIAYQAWVALGNEPTEE